MGFVFLTGCKLHHVVPIQNHHTQSLGTHMHSRQRIGKCISKRSCPQKHHNPSTTHICCAHHPKQTNRTPSTTNLTSIVRHLQSCIQKEHIGLTITFAQKFLYTKKWISNNNQIDWKQTTLICKFCSAQYMGNHKKRNILVSHIHESQKYPLP